MPFYVGFWHIAVFSIEMHKTKALPEQPDQQHSETSLIFHSDTFSMKYEPKKAYDLVATYTTATLASSHS